MVDVATKIQTPGQRMKERAARVRKMSTVPGVRVVPKNDDMRRLLKHPTAGGFRSEGSIEWPNDTFTKRRLRDGDITIEVAKDEHAKDEHARHARPKRGHAHEHEGAENGQPENGQHDEGGEPRNHGRSSPE